MNYFKKRAKSVRDRRTRQVLALLLQTPREVKTAEELGAETGLGAVVYPLLADLDREALVELEWRQRGTERQLTYRLTAEGLNHARRLTAEVGPASVGAARPVAAFQARLAPRTSKRSSDL